MIIFLHNLGYFVYLLAIGTLILMYYLFMIDNIT
jgi:hypothetical protein